MRNIFCTFFNVVCCFLLFSFLSPTLSFSDTTTSTPVRGDYDGDGYQDLAVGIVEKIGGSYKTSLIARGKSDQQVTYSINKRTDAFANGKYFKNQPTTLASVLVTSLSESLLWTFVNPATKKLETRRYGKPGDTISNAIDFDTDMLDDVYVIRPGSVNELNDNKQYLHWFISLSKSAGTVIDVVFGIKGDKTFTFYKDGKPYLGVLRVEKKDSATCKKGQFGWYYMNYSPSASLRKVSSACWGSSGDIPLTPTQISGQLKLIAVRVSKFNQTAYIRSFTDSADTIGEKINLGSFDSIPGFANFSSDAGFFWHKYDNRGVVTLKQTSSNKIVDFGTAKSVTLRPDGTVVQAEDSDRFGTIVGESPCSEKITRGYLWKPSSQDTNDAREGYPLILSTGYYLSSNCLQVLSKNYQQISCLGEYSYTRFYEGYGCGLNSGSPCYGRSSASQIAESAKQVGGSKGGYIFDPGSKRCFEVTDFSSRVDRR